MRAPTTALRSTHMLVTASVPSRTVAASAAIHAATNTPFSARPSALAPPPHPALTAHAGTTDLDHGAAPTPIVSPTAARTAAAGPAAPPRDRGQGRRAVGNTAAAWGGDVFAAPRGRNGASAERFAAISAPAACTDARAGPAPHCAFTRGHARLAWSSRLAGAECAATRTGWGGGGGGGGRLARAVRRRGLPWARSYSGRARIYGDPTTSRLHGRHGGRHAD